MSSAIFCQENEHAHGMLQSLGLDSVTIQACGFSILVLYFAYQILFFFPKRRNRGVEGEPSLKNFDAQPTDAAHTSPGELNCCLRWLTTVFPRPSSARYDSVSHVSICHAC